ncbi:MAG: hypothetical protein ABUJ98_15285, partial [Hyphomicrobium sp.]
ISRIRSIELDPFQGSRPYGYPQHTSDLRHVMFCKARRVLSSLWLLQAKQLGGLKGSGQAMRQALKR